MSLFDATGLGKPPRSELVPGNPKRCHAAVLLYPELSSPCVIREGEGSIANFAAAHSLLPAFAGGSAHYCMHETFEQHEQWLGITLHECACTATFYYINDAVRVIVGSYEQLRQQVQELSEELDDKHGY